MQSSSSQSTSSGSSYYTGSEEDIQHHTKTSRTVGTKRNRTETEIEDKTLRNPFEDSFQHTQDSIEMVNFNDIRQQQPNSLTRPNNTPNTSSSQGPSTPHPLDNLHLVNMSFRPARLPYPLQPQPLTILPRPQPTYPIQPCKTPCTNAHCPHNCAQMTALKQQHYERELRRMGEEREEAIKSGYFDYYALKKVDKWMDECVKQACKGYEGMYRGVREGEEIL